MTIGHAILKEKKVILTDLMTWANWFEENEGGRHVAHSETSTGVKVSTVFLGIDQSMGGESPLWFETMIFGGPLNHSQWRYATWDEAVEGHKHAVNMAEEEK